MVNESLLHSIFQLPHLRASNNQSSTACSGLVSTWSEFVNELQQVITCNTLGRVKDGMA